MSQKVICIDALNCESLGCPHNRPHEPYPDNKCRASFCSRTGKIEVCAPLEQFINVMLDIKEGKV